MKHHDLKCVQPYYDWIKSGMKTFEIRIDDRDYQPGDTVCLHLYDAGRDEYAGEHLGRFTIGCVTSFQQQPGWIVFSLLAQTEGKQ